MATPKNGFVGCRHLTGGRTNTKLFKVNNDANNAFAIGDAVFQTANGVISPVSGAVSANYCGVIQALYKTNNANELIPLTFNQPSAGPYLVTGQAGFAQVIIDPEQTFVAQLDVSASAGLIGNTIDVSASPPDAATGISRHNLRGASLGTDSGRMFKVIGIAPSEMLTGRWGDKPAGTGVEVKLNNTTWNVTTGV